MTYQKVFEAWDWHGFTLRSRICVPPLVIYTWSGEDGCVTEPFLSHYRALVHGGAGLVIQQATSVSREGRLTLDQLGLWDDSQIDGLRQLVDIFHEAKMPAIVQLSHAGILAAREADRVCPSDCMVQVSGHTRCARELTIPEIEQIERDFIAAAQRAYRAGYDGVELHACHGYLLSEFLNAHINHRQDAYNAADRLILRHIIDGIRAVTPPDFILGIRLGAFEPSLRDGLASAQWCEAQGLDFIDAYYGCDWGAQLEKPADFPHTPAIYGAQRIKELVSIPVFACNEIRTGEQAEDILQRTGVDMIVPGRAHLVNPSWGNDIQAGRDSGTCFACPVCHWKFAPETCPGRLQLKRSKRHI